MVSKCFFRCFFVLCAPNSARRAGGCPHARRFPVAEQGVYHLDVCARMGAPPPLGPSKCLLFVRRLRGSASAAPHAVFEDEAPDVAARAMETWTMMRSRARLKRSAYSVLGVGVGVQHMDSLVVGVDGDLQVSHRCWTVVPAFGGLKASRRSRASGAAIPAPRAPTPAPGTLASEDGAQLGVLRDVVDAEGRGLHRKHRCGNRW